MASPQFQSQGYLPNGSSATPGAQALLPNNGRIIQNGATRVLCVADVRGNLQSLNELAKTAKADHIIHTGDFGFYDDTSLERIADKTLKHVAQYSPLLNENVKRQIAQIPPSQQIKSHFRPDQLPLSQLTQLLNNQITLDVPVYTVWGACEDVRVLEKFRSGEYSVPKLHIIDEASSRLLDIGGVKLRLLGLGGAVVMHKLFDNGEGKTTIAGGQGTMWTTLLQMGELVDTANRVYDPQETRVFVTHASPAREGMLNQLSVTLKADFSISAGLHFRYGSSYNEFSVNPTLDHYRGKLAASKASFHDVWETVRSEVENAIMSNDSQKTLLDNALDIVHRMPSVANGGNPFGGPVGGNNAGGQVDESAFKNMWNFNLADAAFGYLVLEIEGGRIGTEMRAQGFNFAHRGGKPTAPAQSTVAAPTAVSAASMGPNQSRPAPVFAAPQQPFPQTQQSQVTKPQPPTTTTKPAPSPAPVTSSQGKPMTPQPTTSNVNLPTAPSTATEKPPSPTTNGAGSADKSSDAAKAASSPAQGRTPSAGMYITGPETEDAVRELFTDAEKPKIKSINKFKNAAINAFVVQFETVDECKAIMERYQADAAAKPYQKGVKRVNIKYFEERARTNVHRESQGGAGTWQSSNRGAASAGTRAGYQSGGASDSEGARRGAYRGRGGRGRGEGERSDRGDRGGRGRGGAGRGSFQGKPDGPSESKPAGDKPATPAGGES